MSIVSRNQSTFCGWYRVMLKFWDFVDMLLFETGDFDNLAQTLCAKGDELFYYVFPSETSNHSYEVDFLLSRDHKVCPLEVKSAGYSTHPSIELKSKIEVLAQRLF